MFGSKLLLTVLALKAVSATGTPANACNADNCLRAMRDVKVSSSASAFCQTYTTTVDIAIPTYLGGCSSLPSRVSSACSCLVASTSSTSTAITTSASIPSPTTTSFSRTTTTSRPLSSTSLDCHQDNCYRALQNPKYSIPAAAFCSSFTLTVNTEPTAIPSYLSNCHGSPTEVSSACSCVHPTPTPTPCVYPSFAASSCGVTKPAAGSAQSNFVFECGQSYDTTAAASVVTAESSDDCLSQCDSQPGCKGMTFSTKTCSNNCYLFSSLDSLTTTTSPSFDSASFACAALTAPDASTCGTSLPMASNSRTYQVQCGLAYTGTSSFPIVTAANYNDCFNKCGAESSCAAFTFDSSVCSNNCQLFSLSDDLSAVESSETKNSGYTLANARDYTCGKNICGAATYGGGRYNIGYLLACRSSYNFDQQSNVQGSPFTATSFKDCLLQCDNTYACNYMSFDSSKFTSNCAMFSRNGVSIDPLTLNPSVDSAKALPGQAGSYVLSPPDTTSCPVYDSTSGTCPGGNRRFVPPHDTGYNYLPQCKKTYIPGSRSLTSTLTVNTFAQCLDACDKNNHCTYMSFAKPSTATLDNCKFISGSATKQTDNGYDSASDPYRY